MSPSAWCPLGKIFRQSPILTVVSKLPRYHPIECRLILDLLASFLLQDELGHEEAGTQPHVSHYAERSFRVDVPELYHHGP